MEDERLRALRDRTDRLQAERLQASRREGRSAGTSAERSGETAGGPAGELPGPPHASEEWRRFYGAVRDAVLRLRR